MVAGRSLFCSSCKYRYRGDAVLEGSDCRDPKCAGKMVRQQYLVDLTMYDGVGKCCCDKFSFAISPQLKKMTPVERLVIRASDEFRCHHIIAAMRKLSLAVIDKLNEGSCFESREYNGE